MFRISLRFETFQPCCYCIFVRLSESFPMDERVSIHVYNQNIKLGWVDTYRNAQSPFTPLPVYVLVLNNAFYIRNHHFIRDLHASQKMLLENKKLLRPLLDILETFKGNFMPVWPVLAHLGPNFLFSSKNKKLLRNFLGQKMGKI